MCRALGKPPRKAFRLASVVGLAIESLRNRTARPLFRISSSLPVIFRSTSSQADSLPSRSGRSLATSQNGAQECESGSLQEITTRKLSRSKFQEFGEFLLALRRGFR